MASLLPFYTRTHHDSQPSIEDLAWKVAMRLSKGGVVAGEDGASEVEDVDGGDGNGETVGVGRWFRGFGKRVCWRRESDDEVEREEGRRWMVGQWQIEGSGFSRVSGFRGWGKQRKRTGRRRNTRGRGGGWFTLSGPVQLNRFGFYLLFSFFLTGFLSLLARFFSLWKFFHFFLAFSAI